MIAGLHSMNQGGNRRGGALRGTSKAGTPECSPVPALVSTSKCSLLGEGPQGFSRKARHTGGVDLGGHVTSPPEALAFGRGSTRIPQISEILRGAYLWEGLSTMHMDVDVLGYYGPGGP